MFRWEILGFFQRNQDSFGSSIVLRPIHALTRSYFRFLIDVPIFEKRDGSFPIGGFESSDVCAARKNVDAQSFQFLGKLPPYVEGIMDVIPLAVLEVRLFGARRKHSTCHSFSICRSYHSGN